MPAPIPLTPKEKKILRNLLAPQEESISEQDWIRDKSKRGPLMKGNNAKMSEQDVAEAYRRRKAGQSNVSKYPGRGSVDESLVADSKKTGKVGALQGPALGFGGFGEKQDYPKKSTSAPAKKQGAITQTDFAKKRQGQVKADSTANQGNKFNKPTKIVGGFKGNWVNAAPSRKPKTLQEAARRGLSDEFIRGRMNPRNRKG